MPDTSQSPQPEVVIREFQPGDEAAFYALNEEWIAHYFRIEEKDAKTLANPGKYILEPGGKILLAVASGHPIGCCALMPIAPDEYEVAKMAVTAAWRGAGIGRKLLQATIDTGKAIGAHRLYLETNHTLTPAIRLYEALGFRHLPPERVTPSPYARADVFMEMLFK